MKIKGQELKTLHREFKMENLNEEDRTVEIAFSSEEPYLRFFGYEILSHKEDAVDMSRIQNSAPLLLDHNREKQIGVVLSASIDDDNIGRAKVKLSKSDLGQEILQDIRDDIRKKISVGYSVEKMVETGKRDDVEVYTVERWMPFEVSVVSIAADDGVGIGRNADIKETIKETKMEEKKAITPEVEKVDVAAIKSAAMNEEKARIREIDAISAKFKMPDEMKAKAIDSGISTDAYRELVLDAIEAKADAAPVDTSIGMSKDEVKSYSLFKAINASRTGNWKEAAFELECSQKVAEKIGKEARGFYVPFEVQRDTMGTGAATGITDAGALVGTDHLGSSFIDALRAESVIGRLGGRFLSGLRGNVDIPRLTAGATFYWLAEGEDVTDSNATLDSVVLSPKTIAGSVPMTRRLLKQSDPSVEAIIRQDLIIGAALAIDAAVIAGTGANGQPLGIIGTTGVNTVVVADATNSVPTFAETVQFETAVAEDNALRGSLNYLTTPSINGAWKSTVVDAGSGLMVRDGKVNGYPAEGSTLVPAQRTIFGNFNDIIIGMWGVLDIEVDKATLAASGGLVLRVFQDVDVAIRHPESFAIDAEV